MAQCDARAPPLSNAPDPVPFDEDPTATLEPKSGTVEEGAPVGRAEDSRWAGDGDDAARPKEGEAARRRSGAGT